MSRCTYAIEPLCTKPYARWGSGRSYSVPLALFQFGVLVSPAPGFFHGVFGLVFIDFGVHDLVQIQTVHVRHQNAVAQHIRQFLPHFGQFVPAFQIRAAPLIYLQ